MAIYKKMPSKAAYFLGLEATSMKMAVFIGFQAGGSADVKTGACV